MYSSIYKMYFIPRPESAKNFEHDDLYISYFLELPKGGHFIEIFALKTTIFTFNSTVRNIFHISTLQNISYIDWFKYQRTIYRFSDWHLSGNQPLSGVTQTCSTKYIGRVSLKKSMYRLVLRSYENVNHNYDCRGHPVIS